MKNKGFHLPKTFFLGTKKRFFLMVLGAPGIMVFLIKHYNYFLISSDLIVPSFYVVVC